MDWALLQPDRRAAAQVSFTPDQVIAAIKRAKASKAMGPDHISPIMLKHLGNIGILFLTNLYNNILLQSIVPPMWKVGRIIPLLKPNKPADQGSSFRPISLLAPAAKILERLILVPIQESINFADHQHGFRKGRSTLTALQAISDHITTGLNKSKPRDRTVLVAIDLSKAFDTVSHETLLNDIAELPLNSYLKRFLACYLNGRQTFVEFRGAKSRLRTMKQGVPQGGILSPTLFNLYMSKMPQPPDEIKLVTYADDSTVLKSGPTIGPICEDLNSYLDTLLNWFKSRNLELSAPKSSATLFTTFSNEMSVTLPITINGQSVPTKKDPTILGVTLDPMFNFGNHATSLKSKLDKKNNLLKTLAGTSWGKEKETLLTTYKAISGSLLNYGAPIWTPNLSASNWNELQSKQNAALRVATGCLKMTAVDHLHAETKTLPVKEHCEMLSKQFLLSTTQHNHPNHGTLEKIPLQRHKMRDTLATRFSDSVRPLTLDGVIDPTNYKEGLKEIHTRSVASAIRNQADNKVLAEPAPPINKNETTLTRRTRTTLAQLRSGYSTKLNSYLNRITDSCPDCEQSPHSLHI